MSREGAITPPRKPAAVIAAVSKTAGNVTVAITSTIAALTAKQAAETWPWRWVRSARKPPASTPTALAPRYAVSAMLAVENEVS